MIMAINASRKSSGGMCRRKRWRAPIASRTMLRFAYASAAFFFRRSSQKYPATSRGTAASNQRSSGHWKVMGRFQMRRQNSAAAQLAAALAQVGKAQNRVDEIVLGRKLQRVHAGAAKRGAQLPLAPLRCTGEAPAEAAIVRIHEQLLAGLRILHDEQSQIGQLHFERIVEAHRDDLVPQAETGERLRPAGCADEVGHDEYERPTLHDGERG